MRSTLIVLAVCVLGGACRGSAEDGSDGGPGPQQFEPSQPGRLEVTPRALRLAVGARAEVTARLYDALGAEMPEPTGLAWSASDPVVSVTDGTVTAVTEGIAEVTVTDGSHGHQRLLVVVGGEGDPEAPFSVRFSPPIVTVVVGEDVPIAAEALTGTGEPVAGPPILELVVRGRAEGDVTAGTLRMETPGLAQVVARIEGEEEALIGALTVIAIERPANGGAISFGLPCWEDTPSVVIACHPDDYFLRFWAPGTTEVLRTDVIRIRQEQRENVVCFDAFVQEEAPDAVAIADDRVVGFDPLGLLTGRAPGQSTLVPSVEGVECEPLRAEVFPAMGGEWSVACSDGSTGTYEVPSWPVGTLHISREVPGSHISELLGNRSILCDAMGEQVCSHLGRLLVIGGMDCYGDVLPIGGGPPAHLCSDAEPCCAVGFDMCAVGGIEEQVILGPDRLRVGECMLTRGGGPDECGNTPDADPCGVATKTINVAGTDCGFDVPPMSFTLGDVIPPEYWSTGGTFPASDTTTATFDVSACTLVVERNENTCDVLHLNIDLSAGTCAGNATLTINGNCDRVCPRDCTVTGAGG